MTLRRSDDPLLGLEDSPRAFVLPKRRILFISLAKNACTTIKWLLADLAGEDLDGFTPGLRNFVNRAEAIHERVAWKQTPRLHEITREERVAIRPDNGWFVFAVTRDPRARLFSAWQNKFLMRGSAHRRYQDEDWYPRNFTVDGIRSDFARFARAMRNQPDQRLMEDTHFRLQTRLLRQEAVDYSRVYDIRELSPLVADLEAHVRAGGYDGPPLSLGRFNETPLRANAELYTPAIRADVEAVYAQDFAAFGERWSFDHIAQADPWAPEALTLLPMVADMGERIGELRVLARQGVRDNRALRQEAERQRKRAAQLERRVERLDAVMVQQSAPEGRRLRRILSAPVRRTLGGLRNRTRR